MLWQVVFVKAFTESSSVSYTVGFIMAARSLYEWTEEKECLKLGHGRKDNFVVCFRQDAW